MTWSRTVRLYTSRSLRPVLVGAIADAVAECRTRVVAQTRHDRGQLIERAVARDERVELRRAEELEGSSHPPSSRPARGTIGRDPAHLAAPDRQSPRVEALTQRQADAAGAVPAGLHDRAF